MTAGPRLRLAYVVGRYPAVSHTFILREVLALRERGVEVETISINRAEAQDMLAAVDREEAARTFSILPPRWPSFLLAHARALLTRPSAYLRTLATAMRLARPGARGKLWELFYFAEAVVVWAHCRRLGIRHLHVHFLNQASDVAMLAIELQGAADPWTWSFTMHGPDEFSDVTMFRLPQKARSARAIACISDFARSQVMAVLDEPEWPKLRIVHCGLVPDEFTPAPRSNGAAPGPLRVLYIGRMVPVKGQGVLLDALAQLERRGVAARATLIGEGPRRAAIERRAAEMGIADRVDVVGAVGQDEIPRYLADSDILVLPSFAEGVPVVLMEAMSMELPVVSTRIAGIGELVEDGVSGFLVAPGRADLLADAMARIATSPELRREMGRRGREKVLQEFDIRTSAAVLEEMFAEVIN